MTIAIRHKALRALASLTGLGLLAACAGTAPASYSVTSPPEALQPEAVPAPLTASEPDGEVMNQWGGVVPDAKPTTPVDDGALGEIS